MTTPLLPTHVIEALDELMFAALCGVSSGADSWVSATECRYHISGTR